MTNDPMIFPNATSSLIKALKQVFTEAAETYPVLGLVRIASRKLPGDNPQPANQIIISPTGSRDIVSGIKRLQGYNVTIYGKTYEDAEVLSTLTEGMLKTIKGLYGIHNVTIDMAAIDTTPSSLEEQRWLTCTAMISAHRFTL